jgi:hypothetical protein
MIVPNLLITNLNKNQCQMGEQKRHLRASKMPPGNIEDIYKSCIFMSLSFLQIIIGLTLH